MVKTRIAPSPTGNLHVGTARTALFSWLYAKQNDGEFVLRLEDTDKKRSTAAFEKDILDGLDWLGLAGDAAPIRQSERGEVYKKYIYKLREKDAVYEEPAHEGEGVALVLKKQKGAVTFTDMIRGEVTFPEEEIQDLVIQKPDGTPTYNFAVAVDDHEMGITHVIRGEDHIPNTPKQIMVYNALGLDVPQFAHLPLLLGKDRSKLSKRHGAKAVTGYRNEGYLPEAMINFLALLGWHPKDEKEIFTPEELIKVFKLGDVQKGGAVFDEEKLDWISMQHIQRMGDDEFREKLKRFLDDELPVSDALVAITKPRIARLAQARDEAQWLQEPHYDAEMLQWKETPQEKIVSNLKGLRERVKTASDNDFTAPKDVENILMPYAEEQGRGEVLWPMRVALSGEKQSPSPFELAALVGKGETIKRLDSAIKKLQ